MAQHEYEHDQVFALPSRPSMAVAIPNARVSAILRSPLHGLLSKSTLLLSFQGRRSRRQFTFPVGYYLHKGDMLDVVPLHNWWTNLRGETPVTVWLKGRRYEAVAQAAHGDAPTVAELERILGGSRALIRVCYVARDAQGKPTRRASTRWLRR